MILYKVDTCPPVLDSRLCAGIESLHDTQTGFLLPHCGTAWESTPPELENIHSPEELAPSGAVPASLAELNAPQISVIDPVHDYDTMQALL